MNEPKIRISLNKSSDTLYVKLPGYRIEPGIAAKTVDLSELVPDYVGPRIYLDFDEEGRLIGLEILA